MATSKGAAARREKPKAKRGKAKPKAPTVKWRGLTLALPAEFPERAYAHYIFDSGTGVATGSPALSFFAEILGEDQVLAVREKIEGPADIKKIVDLVLAEYGMTLGESTASQDS